ncbi:MAG TPA: PD-(D/E)XK nuclease family protein, partial [Thermoanaerobaculia bacterium]|nr:PD-(D/E)XK nuclease family protein [Thermoanaerobaculia bacterium]
MQLFTVEEPRSIVLAGRAESISGNFRLADGEKLKKIGGQREEAEMRRLFYVAVTRAKSDVVFVCNTSEETKNVGFLKCLTEVLGADLKTLGTMWPESGRALRDSAVGTIAFEKILVRGAADRTRRRLTDSALERELAAAEIVPIAIPAPPEVAEILTPAEIAARRAASRNRLGGTLLHRVLELWDGTSSVEPLLAQAAAEIAADGETVARVRKRLAVMAQSSLFQRLLRAETIGREFPVRFVDENGVLVERRIDRLLRENGREIVLDYKSGTAEPARAQKDRDQVERYCRAISTITGRPCDGVVWYVEEDRVVEV